MGLLDFFKKKSEETPEKKSEENPKRRIEETSLENIKEAFEFLTSDYGFQLIAAETRQDFKAENFLVYRNDKSKLQLEICGDESWFHCEIRRLQNGQPAKYSDEDNCIGFESLAVLESDNDYEHPDYFAGGRTGLSGVVSNTVRLLKRYKLFLTTDNWIDTQRIEYLRYRDRGITIDSPAAFFGLLKKRSTKLLNANGYKLILEDNELGPFDSSNTGHFLTFERADKRIKIAQAHWWDPYYIYRIEVGRKRIFELNILDLDRHEAVEILLKEVSRLLK